MVDEQKTRALIGWTLALLPLALFLLLLAVNADYMLALFVLEPPWIVVNLLPCGWPVIPFVLGLALAARLLLSLAEDRGSFVWTWLLRLTAVALVLLGIFLVTMMPALLTLLR